MKKLLIVALFPFGLFAQAPMPQGGQSINYTPLGTGAVARTINGKLQESVSVGDFGVVADEISVTDASITAAAAVLTTGSSGKFSAGSVGKSIIVAGAGTNGVNLITTISGFTNANSVTLTANAATTVSGVNAYFGTNNATNLATALTAACGGGLYFPTGSYLSLTGLITSCATGVHIYGTGYGSLLIGDVGDNALLKTNGAAQGIEISDLQVSNIYTLATSGGTQYSYIDVYFDSCVSCSIHDSFLTSGREGVAIFPSGGVTPSDINIHHNVFSKCKDYAVGVYGDSASSIYTTDIDVTDNFISGTVTTGLHGPPHDINDEDSWNVLIARNTILDGSGITESNASCIQVYGNGTTMNNVSVLDNICRRSPVGTMNGFETSPNGALTYSNIVVAGNTFDGYAQGIYLSGDWTANLAKGFSVTGNTVSSPQLTGIYGFYSSTSTPARNDFDISNNKIVGPGNLVGGTYGIRMSGLDGIKINNNQISLTPDAAILLEGSTNSQVNGNHIYKANQHGGTGAIKIFSYTGNGTNNEINGNFVYGPQSSYGIVLDSSTSGNTLTGNTIEGTTTANINYAAIAGTANYVSDPITQRTVVYQKSAGGVTLDGSEDTIYTASIPGGSLVPGGCLNVWLGDVKTSGANSTTFKLYYGATAITAVVSTSTSTMSIQALVCDDPGATNAQEIMVVGGATGSTTINIPNVVTASIDSTAAQTMKLTATGTNGDVITPKWFLVAR